MEATKRYRPLSYLQTNAEDIAKELAAVAGPLVITENGVPSFVCLSFEEYHRINEVNALAAIVDMGQREISQGKIRSLSETRAELDGRFLR
jgi:PHD/YefM family antitoxin component YafN of YafNO toxin-antitoxin module